MPNFTVVNEIQVTTSQTKNQSKMETMKTLENIEIGRISPSPRNPRKTFNEEDLAELATNIKNQGLLQPITVRPVDYDDQVDESTGTIVSIPIKFEIVCGERRYRAVSKIAEETMNEYATIACIVKEMTDDEAFDAMITENLQRKDVDPIEEAFAFSELIKAGNNVDDIAARFGKSKRFVQERCKLNTLIAPIKELTTSGNIPIAGAILVAKLSEELQNKYYASIKSRVENNEESTIGVQEINNWITREFMRLDSALFLEYDEDDEEGTKPPTEDWNTQFEKCATCCMNTGNVQCMFYSMKGEHKCTDRQCFEKKTAAYMFHEIEQYADRLTMADKTPQVGNVVIVNDIDESYGYENVKNVRKQLFAMIAEKGYMVAKPDLFDGQCKYYGDDERIPELLEKNKIIECISTGSNWNLEVRTVYYYLKGGRDAEPEQDPIEKEARELADKYDVLLNKMNNNANEELRKWCTEKKYNARKGKLATKEEISFWSLIVLLSDEEILREAGATLYMDQEKIYAYVKNNLTEENMLRWQRSFINKVVSDKATYNKLAQRCMRDCFKIAYPKDFEELSKKHADQFEKKSEKIKLRLEEIGYNVKGKKINGES